MENKLDYLYFVRDLLSGIFVKDRLLILDALEDLNELVDLRAPTEVESDTMLQLHDELSEDILELEADED